MNESAPVLSAPPALLERILKLSKSEYAVFLELGQGWELEEIATRLRKNTNALYVMVWRMRPKLGIETLARLRFEATRYVLSGLERKEVSNTKRHFVLVQDEKTASAA